LSFQIQKRGDRRMDVQPGFSRVGENVIIGSTQWVDEDGSRQERFQVLTLRAGKIVDIQGCATRRQAERFARR
jgi:hypothetical protein